MEGRGWNDGHFFPPFSSLLFSLTRFSSHFSAWRCSLLVVRRRLRSETTTEAATETSTENTTVLWSQLQSNSWFRRSVVCNVHSLPFHLESWSSLFLHPVLDVVLLFEHHDHAFLSFLPSFTLCYFYCWSIFLTRHWMEIAARKPRLTFLLPFLFCSLSLPQLLLSLLNSSLVSLHLLSASYEVKIEMNAVKRKECYFLWRRFRIWERFLCTTITSLIVQLTMMVVDKFC